MGCLVAEVSARTPASRVSDEHWDVSKQIHKFVGHACAASLGSNSMVEGFKSHCEH